MRIRRAQFLVDDDAALVERDAGRLQAEPFGIDPPAGGHQQVRCASTTCSAPSLPRSVAAIAPAAPGHLRNRGVEVKADAFGHQLPVDDRREIGILARQRCDGAMSTTVTSLPRRRNACASSQPIGPLPMTMSEGTCSRRSNTVSLVR